MAAILPAFFAVTPQPADTVTVIMNAVRYVNGFNRLFFFIIFKILLLCKDTENTPLCQEAMVLNNRGRGANENTNGLVRQYVPEGSDFTNITQEFLKEVERKLNEGPRKRHGFLSPNQVFSKMTGLDARHFV